MNPNLDEDSFMAIQYTIQTDNPSTEFVDVSVREELLPGFLWKIPVSSNQSRKMSLLPLSSLKRSS